MFDIERAERYLIAFLAAALLVAVGIIAYNKSRPVEKLTISRFSVGKAASPAAMAKVNINKADAEELSRLKGVGKALAGRIVEYRSSKGLFISKEDIMKVEGIGPALYGRVKDEIDVE